MPDVAIALGSNIDPEVNLKVCAQHLRRHWPNIRFSSVYKTKAQLHEDQNDFLNAAAVFETDQSIEDTMKILEQIEQELGKAPPFRYGPRTIDIDILLYGDFVTSNQQLVTSNVVIPHPKMHERLFVLAPFCELIHPDGQHPALKISWEDLRKSVENQPIETTEITL